jgi:dTMP kinase
MKSIVFEGGEGSGKGTVVDGLEKYLKSNGATVIRTREPGGTKISEAIRGIIVDNNNTDMASETEALLFAASRAQLIRQVIAPTIEQYKNDDNAYFLIDRYIYSNLVYQGIVRGLGIDNVLAINQMATGGWYPDVAIYLDIAPERGLARIAANPDRECNRLDREALEFHKKVRAGYLSLAERFNLTVIDADATPDVVLERVIQAI